MKVTIEITANDGDDFVRQICGLTQRVQLAPSTIGYSAPTPPSTIEYSAPTPVETSHGLHAPNEMDDLDEKIKKEIAPKKARKVKEEPPKVEAVAEVAALEVPEVKNESKASLTQVIDALKTYATNNSREMAAKILAKHGVKSVRDLKEENYAAVIKECA